MAYASSLVFMCHMKLLGSWMLYARKSCPSSIGSSESNHHPTEAEWKKRNVQNTELTRRTLRRAAPSSSGTTSTTITSRYTCHSHKSPQSPEGGQMISHALGQPRKRTGTIKYRSKNQLHSHLTKKPESQSKSAACLGGRLPPRWKGGN